jgi:hypothetical protein
MQKSTDCSEAYFGLSKNMTVKTLRCIEIYVHLQPCFAEQYIIDITDYVYKKFNIQNNFNPTDDRLSGNFALPPVNCNIHRHYLNEIINRI